MDLSIFGKTANPTKRNSKSGQAPASLSQLLDSAVTDAPVSAAEGSSSNKDVEQKEATVERGTQFIHVYREITIPRSTTTCNFRVCKSNETAEKSQQLNSIQLGNPDQVVPVFSFATRHANGIKKIVQSLLLVENPDSQLTRSSTHGGKVCWFRLATDFDWATFFEKFSDVIAVAVNMITKAYVVSTPPTPQERAAKRQRTLTNLELRLQKIAETIQTTIEE
jgi:hypothetical protein